MKTYQTENKVFRMDWKAGQMVEIKGVILEVGQKVRVYGYAMSSREYVCASEPDARNCQTLVEIGGGHSRTTWEVGMNDRSTAEVFGIGKYYDPSGERLTAEEVARYVRAADIQKRWNDRREENQRKADELERQELRKKWAGVLVPLEDVSDWGERAKTEKANILNYLKYHHPRAKFTARKGSGGHYYAISWQDGPSIKQVQNLCRIWEDHTFNGYEDYNEYTPSQFNRVFGGVSYSCDFCRRYSAAAIEKGRELFREICPELAQYFGTGEGQQLRRDDYDALNDWLNMTVNRHKGNEKARELYEAGTNYVRGYWKATPDRIITAYLDGLDLTPEDEPTPEKPRKGGKERTTEDKATDSAPAEGLELQDIANGVAIIGDSRTTYRNRKEIKTHGATWNKEAQQWQATTPEAVESVRGWFAMREPVAEVVENDAETLPEWVEENAKGYIMKKGEKVHGYITNIHKAFRGGGFVCKFHPFGSLWETPCNVSELFPEGTEEKKEDEPEALNGATLTDFERLSDKTNAPEWLKPGAIFKRTTKDGRELFAICSRLILDGFGYILNKPLNAVDHISAFKGFNWDSVEPVTIDADAPEFARMLKAFQKFRREFEAYHNENDKF